MKELEEKIKYTFKDKSILKTALTHSSYANEKRENISFNERLEFLGDSVLGLVSAEYFFDKYTDHPEGDLTKYKAAAVCENALYGFAKQLDLGKYLYLGKGEEKNKGRQRASNLANAFEALIAAIFIDGGLEEAKKFILRFVKAFDEKEKSSTNISDYKTTLQEVVQENPAEVLEYVQTGEEGPPHDKTFAFDVKINNNVIGSGKGRTKKDAEQMAAKEALKLMGIIK
ncbi:MAG: ribonuclease III [Clostridia bacterium]|nr:ribonuclease III [Clostridia bacterium]